MKWTAKDGITKIDIRDMESDELRRIVKRLKLKVGTDQSPKAKSLWAAATHMETELRRRGDL